MLRIIVQEQQDDGTWEQTEKQECEGCYILSKKGNKMDEYIIDLETLEFVDMLMQAGVISDLIEPIRALKALDEKLSCKEEAETDSVNINVDEMIMNYYKKNKDDT